MSLPQEIERVFLLTGLPPLPAHAAWRIEQGYLPEHDIDEGEQTGTFAEGRVRKKVSPEGAVTYVHTIKKGQGLVRQEIEEAIDESAFLAAWARTEGRRIRKTRYRVQDGDLTWEVDAFDDLPLVMAEVELPSADTPVELPSWLAPYVVRELTEDPRYRNFALATRGMPEG